VFAMPESPILCGVLTLLGTATLLTIPLERLLKKVPPAVGFAGSFALFALLRNVNVGFLGWGRWNLLALPEWLYRNLLTAFLGFPHDGFYSSDYFSLLPWLFLFWTGYYLYRLRRPSRGGVYLPVVTAMGRHSLLIYLLHQPVIYGLLMGLDVLNLL